MSPKVQTQAGMEKRVAVDKGMDSKEMDAKEEVKQSAGVEVPLADKLKFYGLSQDEYERICKSLDRPPQGVEWAIYSALWSEHCSYKSSKLHLKKFFSEGERVVSSFGENAGVIDLGEGERVAFKMESHNHPSFIEPYEGAATGVGGILRDIFTMGARPIAVADYLCFGEPKGMSHWVDGVVRGVGGYGNCVGVPNITGQTEFHSSYNENILVNALALGLFRPGEEVFSSRAKGVGNQVVYVGAKTGRDGVHGASMASQSFDENSESKKPTVQKGDPFYEKLLIEGCIEVMKDGLVEAIQDMGAAGITSSAFEMASHGGVGLKLHLDHVPLRDSTLGPEEILLSESQERMLLICKPENVAKLKVIYQKWDLDAEVIGEVIADSIIELYWKGEKLTALNPKSIVDEAPLYDRPYRAWKSTNRVNAKSFQALITKQDNISLNLKEAQNLEPGEAALTKALKSSWGTSREWVYRQYDQRVGAKTVRDAAETVGVLRLPDSGRPLGIVLGCRPDRMRFDAEVGAMDAIIYPVLELSIKGFEPLAVTDCLNFGNPCKEELMTEFVAAVEGMSKACEAFKTPVISGNVSLYNETLSTNVTSTPSTGLVGLRKDLNLPKSEFCQSGDLIFGLRVSQVQTTGCYFEPDLKGLKGQGQINLAEVVPFAKLLENLAQLKAVTASRVVGKGGLAYALARMTLNNSLGARIEQSVGEKFKVASIRNGHGQSHRRAASEASNSWNDWSQKSPLGTSLESLFLENDYEVIFTVSVEELNPWLEAVKAGVAEAKSSSNIQWALLGEVGGEQLIIDDRIKVKVPKIIKAYESGMEALVEGLA